jgi:uncharacterized heparinase superfamily protein
MGAIDRMLPALRFFLHQDGSLARFNGMGATIHDRIAAILRHDDTAGAPLLHAPHSGYERLCIGDVTVIADTGIPPPTDLSGTAHAGCLSFELSSGRQHFIVNAGIDTYGDPEFRPLARATAAHSTATLNDTSSARFSHSPRISNLVGSPLVGGPAKVDCHRDDGPDHQSFVASHDGYVQRFGIIHERELTLSAKPSILTGRDSFRRPSGEPVTNNGRDFISVRFHLHPEVKLFKDGEDRLVLAAGSSDGWVFACDEIDSEIEESIYFAGIGGPRISRQLVLSFKASELPQVHWRLTRVRTSGRPDWA